MRNLPLAVAALLVCLPISIKADTDQEIVVKTESAITIQTSEERGKIYTGTIARDVFWGDGDAVAIPKGSPVELIVIETGPGEMTVDIGSITVNGRRYVADAEYETADGGGIVEVIPTVFANGEQAQPQGREIRIPSETVLHFQQPSLVLRPACRHCM